MAIKQLSFLQVQLISIKPIGKMKQTLHPSRKMGRVQFSDSQHVTGTKIVN